MNEVHKWLEETLKLPATTQGSWVWCDVAVPLVNGADEGMLRSAGFKCSTKRNRFFHVSTKFLPGEMAIGYNCSKAIPFPVGYVKRKPGPKKGSKRAKEAIKESLHKVADALCEYQSRVELTNLLATAPD